MNLQPPTPNTHATDGVAGPTNVHRISSAVSLRGISAERRNATSPSNNSLPTSTADIPGISSAEKLQAASGIRFPSLGSKEEISSSLSASFESSSARSGNRLFTLSPSIISKASTLSTNINVLGAGLGDINISTCTGTDDGSADKNDLKHEGFSSASSFSSANEIHYQIDGSATVHVPAFITTYVAASLQSSETIFSPRKNELHFFSEVFRQEYQKWDNDDQDDDDDDEDQDDDDQDNENVDNNDNDNDERQDDHQDIYQHGCAEYSGRLNFAKRTGSYRKSHEIGPLSFVKTLDLDATWSDTESEEEG